MSSQSVSDSREYISSYKLMEAQDWKGILEMLCFGSCCRMTIYIFVSFSSHEIVKDDFGATNGNNYLY
ncbi:hypothetical protein OROHE_008668 [Orobanche hederae]